MSQVEIAQAMEQFIEQYKALNNPPPQIPFDPDWPSDCYCSEACTDTNKGTLVDWLPAKMRQTNDMFDRLEEALDEKIHRDIVTYYTCYWSDPLPAIAPDGELSLLLVWNEEDMERLRGNLLGHALSKRAQKRPLTFFFACPEGEDELFISIDNFSGEVLLEKPGKAPLRKLADNLAEFIRSLKAGKVVV